LNHPHILTVHDAGEFEGRQYLVTEFVDGGTLKDWAKAEKRTWRQTVELLTDVADGLAAAHAAGMTHRDIKPANILVAKNGYAKLADFGLAKLTDTTPEDVTRTLAAEPSESSLLVRLQGLPHGCTNRGLFRRHSAALARSQQSGAAGRFGIVRRVCEAAVRIVADSIGIELDLFVSGEVKDRLPSVFESVRPAARHAIICFPPAQLIHKPPTPLPTPSPVSRVTTGG
jgi:serine/threonine protein kinase